MKIKNKKLKIFLSRKISVAAAVFFLLMILASFIGPFLTTHDPHQMDLDSRFHGISSTHWMGADHMGRDLFTRMIHGGMLSIGLAFFGVTIGLVFGSLFGLSSGYYGGVIDVLISRFIDFLMAVPTFMIAIISLVILGSGGINTGIAVGISLIPLFMRITRAQAVSIRESDYVKSSHIMGLSDLRIIMTHILPGIVPILVVTYTLNLGKALLTSSAIAFLGIGVNPPAIEWGSLLSAARQSMVQFPLGVFAPGLAIMLFVMSTSLIGDGLRDAFDPKES